DNVPGQMVGSLRLAILDANNAPGTPITFNIATGPLVITPLSPLPPITVPVTIDGTTQPGVTINGSAVTGDGLTLDPGSGGSRSRGLSITGFHGNGIVIKSSNNIIGGTAPGEGNTISGNTAAGVLVASGAGNAIRANSIFANGALGIDLAQ